jgi:hypothetical protein
MELSLQTYFDIGVSYGLGDTAFDLNDTATAPDLGEIGYRNPLGVGICCSDEDLAPVITIWRQNAVKQLDRPEMELGFDDPSTTEAAFEEFKSGLRDALRTHPVKSLSMRIYAVGVVFLRLDFSAGLQVKFSNGFLRCFEYAGYTVEVSELLREKAKDTAENHSRQPPHRGRRRESGMVIQRLSKRPDPDIQRDEKGYEESQLLTHGVTKIAMCLDQGDEVDVIKRHFIPKGEGTETLAFEYHGTIHFNWAASVIEPRAYNNTLEPPATQILRMLMCIEVAHTFHGALEAFQSLFFHETMTQAEGFIEGRRSGLSHIELNRMRTLALAVVNLTVFESVTQTAEDQAYFRAYAAHANIEKLHENILSRSDILLEVQKAEEEQEKKRRDNNLNTTILFLTGFAIFSALYDIYEFLKGEGKGLEQFVMRLDMVGLLTTALILILLAITRKVR